MNPDARADEFPVVNPAFIPVRANDVVHLRAGPWSGPAFTVHNEPGSDDARLFDLLDGEHTLSEILAAVGQREDVLTVLERLGRENLLYFLADESSYPRPRIPIQSEKIGVVDDQSVGDVRYRLVTHGEMGSIVTESLDRAQAAFDRTEIDGPDDVATLDLSETDFLVYLSDRHAPRVATRLNRRCLEAEVPWLVGQVNGFDAVVGPTMIPDETACYRCYLDRVEANVDDELYALYYEGSKHVEADAVFNPLRYVVEAYVCVELAHVRQFGQGFTVERTFAVGGTDMSTRIDDVLKTPRCEACADLRDRKRFVGTEAVLDWRERNE